MKNTLFQMYGCLNSIWNMVYAMTIDIKSQVERKCGRYRGRGGEVMGKWVNFVPFQHSFSVGENVYRHSGGHEGIAVDRRLPFFA